jgi:AraC-like DNA-binding protein
MKAGNYSDAVRMALAYPHRRYSYPTGRDGDPAAEPGVIRRHFTVANEPVALQMSAWSDYVSRILEAPITRAQVARGFRGEIDTYVLKDMVYLDSRTDPFVQARTAARISTDNMRDYCFHVAVKGIVDTVTGPSAQRKSTQFVPGIVALDMNQTMRMERPAQSRVLAFFLPRAMVESAMPDAESLHGQVMSYSSPVARLLLAHLDSVCRYLHTMPAHEAQMILHVCAELILAAFRKQVRLGAGARAAARTAVLDQVRRYVQANLHQLDLSPDSVLRAFPLPRANLYRMFEDEGGLAAYIRNCRLRAAAHDLVRLPSMGIMKIAYGLGFNTASDFTRAFRRAYEMTPQHFRQLGLSEWNPSGAAQAAGKGTKTA